MGKDPVHWIKSPVIVNATRIPPGPGHALVVRRQRLAAVCEQAGRSRQKQTEAGKGMQANKGKQRQAGRGRQEKRWERNRQIL